MSNVIELAQRAEHLGVTGVISVVSRWTPPTGSGGTTS